MKKSTMSVAIKNLVTLSMLVIFQTIALAQEATTTTTTKSARTETVTDSSFYTQPWVWVVGAAVFILLLIALLRGNSSSRTHTDRVVISKTKTSNDI